MIIFLAAPGAPGADRWNDATQELAHKIIARTGTPAAVALTLKNLSSLGNGEVSELRRALRAQLRSQGVRLVGSKRAVGEVRITLSENLQGYLWIAEIRRGESQDVAMISVPRPKSETIHLSPETLFIRKALLYEQDAPILDLAGLEMPREAAPRLLVLNSERIALYKKQTSVWEIEQSFRVAGHRPWPRDARGRLVLRSNNLFDAYFPGIKCAGIAQPALSFECSESDDPWPLEVGESGGMSAYFAPGRNFFDGRLVLDSGQEMKVPPFFSAAHVIENGTGLWIFAGLDGRAQLFEKNPEALATFEGWGSDLVGLKTECGTGSQALATHPGDSTAAEAIQAYEVSNRRAIAASPPVEFSGPVTALWPSSNSRAATAVSRNLHTGRYEAFSLSIYCGQ